MAQNQTPMTIVGNLVEDPTLRFTPNGAAVANFRIASTPRTFDKNTNQFVDGEALFMTCNVWRQAAENASNSLSKGDRVIVTGNLKQRSFENKQGERRSVIELDVDEVGPSLKYATATLSKANKGGSGSNSSSDSENPWGSDRRGFGAEQADQPPF